MTDTDPIIVAQAREIHALKTENAELKRRLHALRFEVTGKAALSGGRARRPFDMTVTDHRVCRLLAIHGEVTFEMASEILNGLSNQLSVRISRLRKKLPSTVKIVAVVNSGYYVAEGLDILRKAYDIPTEEPVPDA